MQDIFQALCEAAALNPDSVSEGMLPGTAVQQMVQQQHQPSSRAHLLFVLGSLVDGPYVPHATQRMQGRIRSPSSSSTSKRCCREQAQMQGLPCWSTLTRCWTSRILIKLKRCGARLPQACRQGRALGFWKCACKCSTVCCLQSGLEA